jgi:hypothetical protein
MAKKQTKSVNLEDEAVRRILSALLCCLLGLFAVGDSNVGFILHWAMMGLLYGGNQ